MTAAILEIRDGIAVGPLHQPVQTVGRNCRLNLDDLPLSWNTLCGIRGYVYRRDGLAELGHTSQCLNCYVEANSPKPTRPPYFVAGPIKYETRQQAHEARLASYRRYYERRKQRKEAA